MTVRSSPALQGGGWGGLSTTGVPKRREPPPAALFERLDLPASGRGKNRDRGDTSDSTSAILSLRGFVRSREMRELVGMGLCEEPGGPVARET